MKQLLYILILCLLVQPFAARLQNAPVTTAGVITNATTSGSVIAPVTVTDFSDIGSFTLTLKYKATLVSYVGASPDPAFAGISVTNSVAGSVGKLVIVWSGTSGITLPDQSHLLDLTFTYTTGTSSLSWAYTNGLVCQYKKYAGGTYVTLNDAPKSSFYIDGGISNRGAPVTYAAVISNAAPGTCAVPVTVTNFTNIGSISLKLEYDSSCLVYLDSIPNALFGSSLTVVTSVGQNGKKIITIGYLSLSGSASLPDGSILVTLNFTYSNGPGSGNYSTLNWYDIGPTCQYTDGAGDVLIDIPTANYYKNGLVFTQCAPQTSLPSITGATPNNPVNIPVTIKNFSNIESFTLSFEYDSLVLHYTGFIPNSAFGSSLNIVNNPPGSDGKRKIVISWSGVSPLSLPDGDSLVRLNFTYLSGTTGLTWVISDNTSCRYNDANGNAYYDQPRSTYYQDGLVASHVAPHTIGGYYNPTNGQSIIVPVKVTNFSNIGYFSLMIFYDPGVLTYQNATRGSLTGGTFTALNPESGKLVLKWSSGSTLNLPDTSILVNLAFNYISGNSTLAFYADSCVYAEDSLSPSLYDLPSSAYFINGFIGPNLLSANFTADNVTLLVNGTLHFSDLSTGGPTAWNWSFSPATVTFVDGTNAASQSPHVLIPVNGAYSVTLTVTKGILTSTMTKTNYIHAGTPGLWTGITSTGWDTASNWHNYLVPVNVTDVHIPSTAPNWPSFTGDLTAGTHCNNLTLTGASQLTVTGSFTINTGHSLTVTGSGALKVGGNWSDSGSFITGTGTVEFFGANPGSILAPANETFYNLIENKTSTTFTIPHNVTINGDVTVK